MIYGDRIILRAVEREDLPDYVRWLNDPTVLEYFGSQVPLSLAQEEGWYNGMLQDPSSRAFAVEFEGQHIGSAGFNDIDGRNASAEVGLFIGLPEMWDRGLGYDVLETLSVIRADGHIPLAEIVAAEGAHLSRNTTVVILTPTDQRYWIAAARNLAQRGINVVAVVLEAYSFGHPVGNEELLTELTISGISTYLVREGDDLAQSLSRPYAQGIKPVGRSTQPA